MMNLFVYAENQGRRNIIDFVLIDLKREIREDNVFVRKTKKHVLKAIQKLNLFNKIYVVFF